MPEFTVFAGRAAGVVALAAFIPYIVSILRGQTKPSKSTWWILTIVGVMIYLSYKASGGENTLWEAVAHIFGPLVVALLSLRFGERGWVKLDSICLAGALLSIPIWVLTDSPVAVLVITLFVDFLGILPTLKKSYLRPWTEDRLAWGTSTFASALNIFAVEEWNVNQWMVWFYPIYMTFFNGLIFALLFNPQKRKK